MKLRVLGTQRLAKLAVADVASRRRKFRYADATCDVCFGSPMDLLLIRPTAEGGDVIFYIEAHMSAETITALGVIVAVAAVFYQARAYHLSRKELSVKVEDLSSIVHRLEGEIAARQALDEKHARLMVASLNGDAQALNHATEISGIIQDTVRELSRSMDGTVADITNMLLVHNALIAKESYRTRAAEAGVFVAAETPSCSATAIAGEPRCALVRIFRGR